MRIPSSIPVISTGSVSSIPSTVPRVRQDGAPGTFPPMTLVILLLLLALVTGVLGFVVKWAFIAAVVFVIAAFIASRGSRNRS